MATITTRAGKGSPLTNTEVDDNFTNLNTDKAELSGANFTGNVGIGETNPAKPLHVNSGATDVVARFESTDADARIELKDSASTTLTQISVSGDDLHFGTNATERMRIDSSGNVGIGTTSPQAPLHVHGDINLGNNAGADAADVEIASLNFYNRDTSGSAPNNASIIRAYSHSDTGSGGYLTFATSFGGEAEGADATEAMRIDSSGKVGIGTTSPAFKLDVAGNARASYFALRSNETVPSESSFIYRPDTGVLGFGTGTEERMRIDSSGNVGIGTTSPSQELHIASSGEANIRLQGSGSANYLDIFHNASDFGLFGTGTQQLKLATNSTERMRIDSSGNVLVGTTETDIGYTDSGAGFSVSPLGFAQIARSSDASLLYLNKLDNDGDIILFEKDGLGVGTIGTETGRLTIGSGDTGLRLLGDTDEITPWNTSTNAGRDALIDLGNANNRFKDIYRSGSTYSTSDRNKKQDIRDLTDAEARVATVAKGSLKAFRYIDSVEAEGDEANIHFGIIAQDLKAAFESEGLNANDYQVFKTSTYTDDDGVEQTTYSICYENLLAFIIAAI